MGIGLNTSPKPITCRRGLRTTLQFVARRAVFDRRPKGLDQRLGRPREAGGQSGQQSRFAEFSVRSQIGEPDLVLSMPEPFVPEGNDQDQYQVFVIPTGFTEPTEIAAVEIRPGNAAVDHHALVGTRKILLWWPKPWPWTRQTPTPGTRALAITECLWSSFCLGLECQGPRHWNFRPPSGTWPNLEAICCCRCTMALPRWIKWTKPRSTCSSQTSPFSAK